MKEPVPYKSSTSRITARPQLLFLLIFSLMVALQACSDQNPLTVTPPSPPASGANADIDITTDDRISCALSFLAYLGEEKWGLTEHGIEVKILDLINKNIPGVSVLRSSSGDADWEVVWGPAVSFSDVGEDQENMLFVARQVSNPLNFKVVIRGTNFHSLPNWLEDDLKVGTVVPWTGPNGSSGGAFGNTSEGTANDLAVLTSIVPLRPDYDPFGTPVHLPGEELTLQQFLTEIAGTAGITIGFTGHSLGGGMAPTLALYFAQEQGKQPDSWDPNRNASIAVTGFAGPTPGDSEFARFFSTVIPSEKFRRFVNVNDMVPRAWDLTGFTSVPGMYGAKVDPMNSVEHDVYKHYLSEITGKNYQHMGTQLAFEFPIDTTPNGADGTSFYDQVTYQHHTSYPTKLRVPEVLGF